MSKTLLGYGFMLFVNNAAVLEWYDVKRGLNDIHAYCLVITGEMYNVGIVTYDASAQCDNRSATMKINKSLQKMPYDDSKSDGAHESFRTHCRVSCAF